MAVIFRLSDTPAVKSTMESVGVTERLLNIASRFVDIDPSVRAILIVTLEPYIRKLAHMAEFAVLFFLLVFPIGIIIRNRLVVIFMTGMICFLYACSDEYHQLYVVGRSGAFKDVCIDMVGVLAAMLVYIIFELIVFAVKAVFRKRR